jgi:DNA-binding response OmpR family regulator
MVVLAQRILVVEDNASLRSLFVDVISAVHNLLADGAGSITEAEALLSSPNAHYDAVLLDLGLPDGDGREFCLKLRRDGLRIPIIMLTGVAGSLDRIEGLDGGASDYLIKPVRISDLLVRLEAQLTAFNHAAGATLPVVSMCGDDVRP